MHIVAISADISKMYHQITVQPDDQPLQAVLWRDHPKDKIQTYILTTLTYGTTPAAYIATKCLQVVSESLRVKSPEAANAIASKFYMDDLLSGATSLEAALKKRSMIHEALNSAQFPLRKHMSNSSEFLVTLDASLIEELRPLQFSSSSAAKILGLQWYPRNDSFFINVKRENIEGVILTKRIIASLVA